MRLNTLGRLELLPSDAPGAIPLAVQPKRLALLAYLALATPRGFQRRDVLLGLFWPDLDQEEARRALRQALHYLRHFLSDGVLVSRANEVVGVADGTLWCDAVALEEAFAAGRATEALELYRGDFLEGFFVSEVSAEFEQWVDRTREALRRRAAGAAQSLAEQEEKAGNAPAAILAARKAVELTPDDELAVRQLIGLHRRLDDHAGALRTYDEFARRLVDEFGASPSADTVALVEEVRAGPRPAAVSTGPAVPLPEQQTFDPTVGEVVEAPGRAPAKPVPVRRSPPSVWRRALLVAAAALLTGVIAHLTRRSPPNAPPNATLVAVLPFRTSGAAPELAWLREGMADLLAIKLAGQVGLRAIDPRGVMSAWQRVPGSTSRAAPDAAMAVARRVGAGRVIAGAVVGTPAHLTLTASLLSSPGGRIAAEASVEGPIDSLSPLADQLAARLLSVAAGSEALRLSSISSRSLPAIRAYLAGRAAFRKGRLHEAFTHLREATVLDSTFALAALELVHASKWVDPGGEAAERGMRLATAGRERLAPGDRALLDLWVRPFQTRPELIGRWRAATNAYPERADLWYGLGDAYYHQGTLAGLADPFRLAGDAFQHGWALDSASGTDSTSPERTLIFAEPLNHMVEIAQAKGDTASVRRLVTLGLVAGTSGAERWYLRWHSAVALGGSGRRAWWADSQRVDPEAFALIYRFTASAGIASEDYLRSAELMLRQTALDDPDATEFQRRVLALNGGRPHEAARALAGNLDAPDVSVGLAIREALYWGGDTSVAAEAAWRLVPYAADVAARGQAAQNHVQSLCTLATWRLANGDDRYAEAAIRQLRRAVLIGLAPGDSIAVTQYATLCAALLDATRAAALHLANSRAALERADTAARTYDVGQSLGANLVVARLAEAQGNLPFALRAVRRRAGGYDLLPTWYLSTFLREEGRLAALTGDTAGAIRAYRHYLALRADPEPQVKPEDDRVRAELARLIGDLRGDGRTSER